jgi:hypothetical protein
MWSKAMRNASGHVPFEQLVDLVEDRLSADNRAVARTHVDVCPACAADVAWLKRVIGLMRADEAEDALSEQIARVVQPFPSWSAPPARPLYERILAVLRFDSLRQPLAFGVRSGQQVERQLLYTAADRELDLRMTPAGAAWAISGQVIGPEQHGEVELHGPSGLLRTALNDLCEFTFSSVPAGCYALIVRVGDIQIEVMSLEVGA